MNYDSGTCSFTTYGLDKSETISGSGDCYLTSACMRYFKNNLQICKFNNLKYYYIIKKGAVVKRIN